VVSFLIDYGCCHDNYYTQYLIYSYQNMITTASLILVVCIIHLLYCNFSSCTDIWIFVLKLGNVNTHM